MSLLLTRLTKDDPEALIPYITLIDKEKSLYKGCGYAFILAIDNEVCGIIYLSDFETTDQVHSQIKKMRSYRYPTYFAMCSCYQIMQLYSLQEHSLAETIKYVDSKFIKQEII